MLHWWLKCIQRSAATSGSQLHTLSLCPNIRVNILSVLTGASHLVVVLCQGLIAGIVQQLVMDVLRVTHRRAPALQVQEALQICQGHKCVRLPRSPQENQCSSRPSQCKIPHNPGFAAFQEQANCQASMQATQPLTHSIHTCKQKAESYRERSPSGCSPRTYTCARCCQK